MLNSLCRGRRANFLGLQPAQGIRQRKLVWKPSTRQQLGDADLALDSDLDLDTSLQDFKVT